MTPNQAINQNYHLDFAPKLEPSKMKSNKFVLKYFKSDANIISVKDEYFSCL